MLIPVIRGAYLINEITRDYTDALRAFYYLTQTTQTDTEARAENSCGAKFVKVCDVCVQPIISVQKHV